MTPAPAGVPRIPGRADRIVEAIRTAINTGALAPGQRLVEADLSERFSEGRANVRAALVQLAGEGLVERIQNRGARVRVISLKEAIEITEVRMAVEGLCAARAAERITDADRRELKAVGARMSKAVKAGNLPEYSDLDQELHSLIVKISGQRAAREVLERLGGHNVRHQFKLALVPGRTNASLPQHLEIIDHISAGDPAAAEAAMRDHLLDVIRALPQADTD